MQLFPDSLQGAEPAGGDNLKHLVAIYICTCGYRSTRIMHALRYVVNR
jgi:hypothetical protein